MLSERDRSRKICHWMTPKWPSFGLVLAAALYVVPAQSFVTCAGAVSLYAVKTDGTLNVNWGYGPKTVCNLPADITASNGTMYKDLCQSWYAMILTSYATERQITSSHSNSTTCSQAIGTVDWAWPPEPAYSFLVSG